MDPERVQKVEEAISFAEQRSDDLDSAICDVAARLEQHIRRLDRLEQRLALLETPSDAGGDDQAEVHGDPAHERPPHSGKLPSDR